MNQRAVKVKTKNMSRVIFIYAIIIMNPLVTLYREARTSSPVLPCNFDDQKMPTTASFKRAMPRTNTATDILFFERFDRLACVSDCFAEFDVDE